jgi:hypothetical protein
MVREYEAVLASLGSSQGSSGQPVASSQKNAPPVKASKQKGGRPAATTDTQRREDFLVSDTGQALWVRGQFGLLALAAHKQQVTDLAKITSLSEDHSKALASHRAKVPSVDALRRAAEDHAVGTPDSEVAGASAAMTAAFTPLGLKDYWPEVEKHFAAANLTCVIAPKELSDAATYFHQVLQESGSEQSTSPARMLVNYAAWQPAKTRCLALSLATLPEVTAVEHLAFLMALRQSQGPYGKDLALSALTAQRLIETIRYPEALAILLDLADQDPAFRLPYELLQRIFSARQKGRGAVALQGL